MKRPLAPPAPGSPYHRLARTSRTRWWRTLLALVCLVVALMIAVGAAIGAALAVHDPRLDRAHGSDFDQTWRLATALGGLAAMIPAIFLTARWIDRRPPGSLSSVVGRVRWRWLGTCLLVTTAIALLTTGLAVLVGLDGLITAKADLGLIAGVVLVSAVLVPFQAAAEEYLFRGYLAQALGAYLTGPWIPAILCSLLFGLGHGTVGDQGVWLLIDRVGFGLVAAWLVIRTGGLEAAIGLHAGFNAVGLVLTAVDGSLGTYFSSDEQPATADEALIDLIIVALTALVLLRLARRRDLPTKWTRRAPIPAERPLRLW